MKKILQVFRKLFHKKEKQRKIYLCDPVAAQKCSKEGCWYLSGGPCKCTSKKQYAKLNAKGKPILATDLDIWNDEYWEKQIFGFFDSQKKQGL